MKSSFKRPFARFVKKAHKSLQLAIEDAVDAVCEDPEIGEAKLGDLARIWVYKFKFNRLEYSMAYRPPAAQTHRQSVNVDAVTIVFYQIGSHENFYAELKRYLKSEG